MTHTILITGGTSGIGLATARAFSRQGANIVIAGRRAEAGTAAANEVNALGGTCHFYQADVSLETEVEALIEFVVNQFGQLDFAFNNAGIFVHEPDLENHEKSTWDQVIASNLTSVYLCMRHEIIAMRNQKRTSPSVIINNASIVGHRGSGASGAAYTAAKHGVLGLTRQAAVENADQMIRVNAVSPGPTLTPATAAGLDGPAEAVEARISTLNPTGALVSVEDIASTVVFLCSPAASMINGQDIPLDGGQLAKL